jgi:hypothetical protein
MMYMTTAAATDTAADATGKHITEFSCDDESMLQKNFAALNRGEEMHNYASKWRTKTGEIRHVLIDSNIHRGKDGGIRNTRCFIRDGECLYTAAHQLAFV